MKLQVVRKPISEFIRCGMAFTLVGTLMVPTAAVAAQANDSNDTAETQQAAQLGDESNAQAAAADDSQQGTDELVTVIVQLSDNYDAGVNVLGLTVGKPSDEQRHASMKDQIRQMAQQKLDEEGLDLEPLTEIADYYNIIDGFAVKIPASIVDDVKALDGVDDAFEETAHQPQDVEEDDTASSVETDTVDASDAKNANALQATGSDQVSQKGDGQLIAIIDTGLQTDHEAFSGDLDDSQVKYTQDSISQTDASLNGGGKDASYVSEKIPFAYDYADHDNNVNPGVAGEEHGTHVAGIAAANGGDQIRGVAPDAQLAIMKVASDGASGAIYDSAILSALEDAMTLKPDAINMSLGADGGFSDDSSSVYNKAIQKLEDEGVTVNVAEGNSYSSAYHNQSGQNLPYATDPDSGIVSNPASAPAATSVASVQSDAVQIKEKEKTYLTAADGSQVQYIEFQGPDGEKVPSFADVADGTYDYVYGGGARNGVTGDVTSDADVKDKVVIIDGHYDFYGLSIQNYARQVAFYGEKGAKAVIVIDSEDEALPESVEYGEVTRDAPDGTKDDFENYYKQNLCPAIFVSHADGEALKAAATKSFTKTTAQAAGTTITAGDGSQLQYTEIAGAGGTKAPSISDFADGTYDYIYGGGAARDMMDTGDVKSDDDVKGKIVLVDGHAMFYGISQQAYARAVQFWSDKGAAGVILIADEGAGLPTVDYGTDGGQDFISSYDSVKPAILVSYEDGQKLKAAATKTLTLKTTKSEDNVTSYYQMSNYSSWGVTPDLKLKPDVAAPGGNVYSSLPGNTYGTYSGTSMATPQMSGITALMSQYIEGDSKFQGMSAEQQAQVASQLVMSTAKPLQNTSDLSTYYSPRQQGAGLANVAAAMQSEVYAQVQDAADPAKPKADLGESNDGTWSFTIKLTNLSQTTDHYYAPDAAALSEEVADGLFQQVSKNWTGQGIDVSFSGSGYSADKNLVSVYAGQSVYLTVNITCQDDFKNFASQNTPNGTFVDGFAFMNETDKDGASVDNAVDLSVPFLGFYGDWSKAPVFDGAIDSDYHIYGTNFLNAESGAYLGVNPMDDNASNDASKVDMSKLVVSNSGFYGAPNYATSHTGLLRGVNNLSFEVEDPSGESQGLLSYDYTRKTFYHQNARQMVAAEDNTSAPGIFHPTDDSQEGAYTFKETALTAGPGAESQSQSFTLYFDKTAPEITSIAYDDNNGDPQLTFTVKDNYFVGAVDLVNPDVTSVTPWSKFYRVLVDDSMKTGTDSDGNNIYTVKAKVSDIKAAWGTDSEIPNTVAAYAWDYGKLRSQEVDAAVVPVAATGVSIDQQDVSVVPGQSQQLSATMTPANTTDQKIEWSSSNTDVATVDENGKVTGVADGEATITASVAGREGVTATTNVKVSAVSDATGIVISDASGSTITDGGTTQLSAVLAPSLEGKTVTWSTSDDQIDTVAADADDSRKVTVTGGYQVGDATITASVTGNDGTVYTATSTIANRTADYADWIIDENNVLRGYKGANATATIPNNVTEIGEAAFKGEQVLTDVTIPASVKKIDKEAFTRIVNQTSGSWSASGTSKQLHFENTEEHPSQLTEIGERAFADGGVAGTLELPNGVTTLGKGFLQDGSTQTVVIPASVTEIPDDAFNTCRSLENITIPDTVTSIGANAFNGDLFFSKLGLSGTDDPDANGLPSHLTEIGESAFAGTYLGADGTSTFDIPAAVKDIPVGLFSGDRFVTGVTMHDGLESIGQSAFNGTSITEVTIPDTVTSVGWNAFGTAQQLREVNVGRNVGAGQLEGAFSWNWSLAKFNVPDDAKYYAAVDGVLYNKDVTTLEVYPLAHPVENGTYTIPDGVTAIATHAFGDVVQNDFGTSAVLPDNAKLSNIVFPNSLQTIAKNGIAQQFDIVDLGSNIVNVEANAFRQDFYSSYDSNHGFTPNHLIVRGGVSGTYHDTEGSQGQTAYFGEGMKNLDFSQSGAPAILVVPSDLASLDLSGNKSNPSAVTIYAPEGSAGWSVAERALKSIGADPATQLKAYTPITAQATFESIPEAGQTVSISADAEGGVDGGYEYRFVQENADGTQTVLKDWSSDSTCDWTVPEGSAIAKVQVRDATKYSVETSVGALAAPVISKDVDTAPVTISDGDTAPELSVEASADKGAAISYQWYEDGKAIAGATDASYTPAGKLGTHEYNVVVTAAKDGYTSQTTSATATVTAESGLHTPSITQDLPDSVNTAVGEPVQLSAAASSKDGADLTYQWYKDGQPIEGATNATYTVDASEAGAHGYYVVVTNPNSQIGESAQSTAATVTIAEAPAETVAMYRLYNPYTGEHFYTADAQERSGLIFAGWSDEGVGWHAPESGAPVYRLYNSYAGDHHYTMDAAERDSLVEAGWTDEGTAFYSADPDGEGSVPLYRQYNPYAVAGAHNYTADAAERDSLVAAGWSDEGIGWYGVRAED